MKSTYKNIGVYQLLTALLMAACFFSSCKKFVDIPAPDGLQDWATTFSNDGSATAAVLDIYPKYDNDVLPTLNYMGGLSADELFSSSTSYAEFLNNNIAITSTTNASSIWGPAYIAIRECNLAVEGIKLSTGMSATIKDQLSGEARFMRAVLFFNLMNLYGRIPLPLSAVETENSALPRAETEAVWSQIFTDLQTAKGLLKPEYPSAERARVNKYAVSALLARAYLYHKDWAKAETEATEVIGSNIYSLENPAGTFKKTSKETILQCYAQTGRSPLTTYFVPGVPTTTPRYYLRTGFDLAFEKNGSGTDDLRKTNWTGKNNAGIYYVNKYKVLTGSGDEYTVLFRLAELYLIRAEARTQQNKLTGTSGAEADLNALRNRAGLDPKSGLNKTVMLAAIEQERKVELFGEYPHRWFDLKRTSGFTDPSKTRADEVLSLVKGSFWQSTDVLFPIPANQIRINPALDQNPGYN
ncbi:RagB/SusD family nutrient uptake outer membrane protein [Pedobacter sp.]|uniref:RagB/SusD family nutrient uptake outer membrane protein n=1 Tax=Pedobacter sp. TaxID=1411316 RepID=UPI002B9917F8|nr:RagB/SusD family nutrient uptake outer membrane protein [Pedobacter sp.]HWW39401.1 RagB/SusD family nutrient uptake outer membrane protein [Pedobacter sp.]